MMNTIMKKLLMLLHIMDIILSYDSEGCSDKGANVDKKDYGGVMMRNVLLANATILLAQLCYSHTCTVMLLYYLQTLLENGETYIEGKDRNGQTVSL